MTAPDAAAVRIAADVLDPLNEDSTPPHVAVVAALARAGWLHDPARIAALEKVAEAVRRMRAVDRGVPHYGPVMEVYAALDTLPAVGAEAPASGDAERLAADDGRERER